MRQFNLKNGRLLLKRSILVAVLPAILLLSGCLNDDDSHVVPDVPAAFVSMYHTAPSAPALDILLDNRRLNSKAFTYSDFNYLAYLRFYTGERELKFTPYNNSNTLLDTAVTFEADEFYSVFLINEDNELNAWIVEDELPDVDQGKAMVRIVHVAPDAESINLTKEEDESPLFSEVEFKNASEFISIDAESVSFAVTSSEDESELATVSNYKFAAGNYYTIVVKGYITPPTGNNNKLSVQVIQNRLYY